MKVRRRGRGMFTSKRATGEVREDVCGRGRCDFCGKVREIVARRGIQACVVCQARKKVVAGRFVIEVTP